MATQYKNMLNINLSLGTTGFVTKANLASLTTVNDRWKISVIKFADTTTQQLLSGAFVVPTDYDSGTAPSIESMFSSIGSGSNVVQDFLYRTHVAPNSLDQSGQEQDLSLTVAAPTTAHFMTLGTLTGLTAGNFAAEDLVLFDWGIGFNEAAHTHGSDLYIVRLRFKYDDGV